MRRLLARAGLLATAGIGAALAFSSTLALATPESLLPPSFRTPAPTPAPSPAPAPAPAQSAVPTPARSPRAAPTAPPSATSSPVVQPLPGAPSGAAARSAAASLPAGLAGRLPSLRELEQMDEDELDALFGLTPEYDIPPGARRALREVGVIGPGEGGLPTGSLAGQPAALVRAALAATRGPLVSRWGHILLRRALASRLDAPRDMDPVAFATLRAAVLLRMGEYAAARALVQDIDTANYTPALAGVALDAYLGTGDVLGICPVAQLRGTLRDDPAWDMAGMLCDAHTGEAREADRQLNRMLARGEAPRIDALLARRYAGAAGEGRRAVTIEWDGVDELTPWRHGLARALGVEVPEGLLAAGGDRYALADALIPAVPLPQRVAVADRAAARGLLSAAAMVDLYSQLHADPAIAAGDQEAARTLRAAYVAGSAAARLAAMQALWAEGVPYGRQVLTAYAAARLPVSEPLAEEAPRLIASMLAAGLDRNAMRWAGSVPDGGLAWALLALAEPGEDGEVSRGSLDRFIGGDDQRKARFLVAGLAGLGRIDTDTAGAMAGQLGMDLARESAWSRRIDRAGELGNPALVALLAGLGMQGDSWDRMTPRHLFHIVRALDRSGLGAEARMIAAEAVARG